MPAPLRNARRDKGRSGLVDDLVVPALLLAGQGWEAAQPALRSPRGRAVVALPLVAIALRVGGPADGRESNARPNTWPYAHVIEKDAAHSRLAPALVASVIAEESAFNPRAHNATSGADGLMQLAPDTARALGVSDPINPRQSVRGGCRYLRELLDRFHDRLPLRSPHTTPAQRSWNGRELSHASPRRAAMSVKSCDATPAIGMPRRGSQGLQGSRRPARMEIRPCYHLSANSAGPAARLCAVRFVRVR